MFCTGDTSLTPADVLERGLQLLLRCGSGRCGAGVSPALRLAPWPKYADVPLVQLYPKLRCEKCRGPVAELVVSQFSGWGSKTEVVLRLGEAAD